MNKQVVEISGTIDQIYPPTVDNIYDNGNLIVNYYQRIVVVNVTTTTHNVQVFPRCVIVFKLSNYNVVFNVGDPVTARGIYTSQSSEFLPTLNYAHEPIGFVRYNGKVYR